MANKPGPRARLPADPARKHSIQVISRAATVLRALEDEPKGLSLGEIAQRVGLARSTVQRIVDALRSEQFLIAASPTAGVRLGPALVRLAASASVEFDDITRPIIAELAQAMGETVDLSVLKGRSAVFTDQIQGSHRLRAVSAIGDSFPLHCTANGKAILSVLSDEKLRVLLRGPLPRLTANTITRAPLLLREIEECRRTGIAVDDEEHTEGISALGTGFVDPLGRAIAVSIPVPTTRFRRIRTDLAPRLLAARARMLAALN
ncbi:MAG: IclR family transcriptional regulator [Gammaproteobacteria bacterium]|nr:IclR family transcriptional regulator [Gammaproteobacteria bacterium]